MRKRWLFFTFTVLCVVSVPSVASAQAGDLEQQLDVFFEHAERVVIAGVEFRGRKTGKSEFTECDGKKIDIGDVKPTLTGPCPHSTTASQVTAFEGVVVDKNSTESSVAVKALDGNVYRVYLPEDGKEILMPAQGSESIISNLFSRSAYSRLKLRKVKVNDLEKGSKIVIVGLVPGRAEAIVRAH